MFLVFRRGGKVQKGEGIGTRSLPGTTLYHHEGSPQGAEGGGPVGAKEEVKGLNELVSASLYSYKEKEATSKKELNERDPWMGGLRKELPLIGAFFETEEEN